MKIMEFEPSKLTYTDLNLTTKFLTPIVFSGDQSSVLSTLLNFGLINGYVDDYGSNKKHNSCLFFLFNPVNESIFTQLENKIISFDSFYDYYEVDKSVNLKMFVFKPNPTYRQDLFYFRQNRFNDMSEEYKKLLNKNIKFDQILVDLKKEIFRFNLK